MRISILLFLFFSHLSTVRLIELLKYSFSIGVFTLDIIDQTSPFNPLTILSYKTTHSNDLDESYDTSGIKHQYGVDEKLSKLNDKRIRSNLPYQHHQSTEQLNRDENDMKIIWKSVINKPFIRVGTGSVLSPPILNGNYQLSESVQYLTDSLTIDQVWMESMNNDNSINNINSTLHMTGSLVYSQDKSQSYGYIFSLTTIEMTGELPKVYFYINITSMPNNSTFNSDISTLIPRIYFYASSNEYETFHGFGESFTYFNLKGYKVPILVSEQGVGRGEEPITSYLNHNNSEGVGGYWYTTYAPKAIYLTNQNHSILIDESVIMFIDLSQDESVEFEVWSTNICGYIFYGTSWKDLIQSITTITGRQKGSLPLWSQTGAIVGLEGGSTNVSKEVTKMIDYGVPITGIWLQDWVGLRHSWDGDRLIWNWELNEEYYPNWNELITQSWSKKGSRVLTYISPFFSNPQNYSNTPHNFYLEGIKNGYFVKHLDGSPYILYSLSIEFCMLDPSNPEAVQWMIEIIKNYTFDQANSSGFMCDFGEYLPFDALLSNHQLAVEYHNLYPEKWAEIANQALEQANKQDDSLFFMRSAWIRSPSYVPVFWLGDQLISWDGNDGLKTVITGALSSGLTGHAITHSDIGGYNTETNLGSDMYYIRTPELLKRWSELAAFGSALYRTHIGSSTTLLNTQVYSSNDSMSHFTKFAFIFANLSTYRMKLMSEAGDIGLPLMRPLALHYSYDNSLWDSGSKFNTNNRQEEYLFGEDFIIAPVLTSGATTVTAYLPSYSTKWIHLWSGNIFDVTHSTSGLWIENIPASLGFPCVFYKIDSISGQELRSFVIENSYADGYQWDDSSSDTDDSNNSNDHDHDWIHIVAGITIIFLIATVFIFSIILSKRSKLRSRFMPRSNPIYETMYREAENNSNSSYGDHQYSLIRQSSNTEDAIN